MTRRGEGDVRRWPGTRDARAEEDRSRRARERIDAIETMRSSRARRRDRRRRAMGTRRTASAEEEEAWAFTLPKSSSDVTTLWRGAPSRYRILFVTVFAFIVCNMDKVNISVSIIPMARDFGWTSTQAGFIQSAFFYGFAVSQLPGGYLSTKMGGARVLPIGMLILSAATIAIPIVGVDEKSIFFLRALVGLGEGVAPWRDGYHREERERERAFACGRVRVQWI